MILEQTFKELVAKYSADKGLSQTLWSKIETHYNETQRHYHNLRHIENLLKELEPVKEQIADWYTVLFAVYYHDIIYHPKASDNEERSADEAVKDLTELGYSSEQIDLCNNHILATKGHIVSDNNDTNLFTDADLSILGKDWESYEQYYKAVRQEYKHVPGILFNPGRKGVLKHFLAMPRIYKTAQFFELYEVKARENMEKEKGLLGLL